MMQVATKLNVLVMHILSSTKMRICPNYIINELAKIRFANIFHCIDRNKSSTYQKIPTINSETKKEQNKETISNKSITQVIN